ncbi:MAG: triose-phosphate isomerase [Saprospiraceae bacterium]|nr:triose-phosphate isomerase [Bacteroidia bacterium]NNL93450.1 triose-phosphate isomerase [Saprospiraceae bacterium]
MRIKIAAGNWKMNLTYDEGKQLTEEIVNSEIPADVQVILGVPAIALARTACLAEDNSNVHIAAQNCHHIASGAYTGEISIPMLKSIGINHVIIGHSERRELFNESDEFLKLKVDALLEAGLTPIFCCGEPLNVREDGGQNEYVKAQFENSIFHLSGEQFSQLIIAYEPIWAIGTGVTASPQQAQDMHSYLRSLIEEKYNNDIANGISILYGGSVKPNNAEEIFGQTDVDGGLVGGASLKSETFIPIINSFS